MLQIGGANLPSLEMIAVFSVVRGGVRCLKTCVYYTYYFLDYCIKLLSILRRSLPRYEFPPSCE